MKSVVKEKLKKGESVYRRKGYLLCLKWYLMTNEYCSFLLANDIFDPENAVMWAFHPGRLKSPSAREGLINVLSPNNIPITL